MKLENGIKKRTAERKKTWDDRENQEKKETEQFIFEREQRSLEEALDIIATKGSIRLIAV